MSLFARVLIVIVISNAASALESPSKETPKLTSVTLQFCQILAVQHSPYLLGKETGIFAKHGIDLTLGEGKGKGCLNEYEAVREGKSRFGVVDALALISYGEKTAGLKFMMSLYQSTAFVYVSPANRKIRSIKDFKGKKIGVLAGGNDRQLLPVALQANGLTMADVTVVEVPSIPEKFPYLMDGKVDVVSHTFSGTPSWQKQAKMPLTILRLSSHGVAIPGDGIYVSAKFLIKPEDKDLNCRMAKAVSESWQFAGRNPAAAIAALHKVNPKVEKGDAEIAKEGFLRVYQLTQLRSVLAKPIGYIFEDDWTRLLDVIRERKILEKVGTLDDYVTKDVMRCLN